jgi:hypothetical protein
MNKIHLITGETDLSRKKCWKTECGYYIHLDQSLAFAETPHVTCKRCLKIMGREKDHQFINKTEILLDNIGNNRRWH